jgi:gamma-glutamylputrescine oxidase
MKGIIMSVSYWQDTVGMTDYLEADITIIGGGLAGLSTAYWLNKNDPTLEIIVVEKGMVGDGASGRNAGFITCGSTDHFVNMVDSYSEDKAEEIWKFTEYNHNLMVEEFGTTKLFEVCDYARSGSWTLASSKQEVKIIKKSVKQLTNKGINVEWNDTTFEGAEGFYGGAYYADDGEIHPLKYLWHLALSTGHKVQIMENSEVFGIGEEDGKLVVRTNKKRIRTEAVVLCTNAWSSQLFSWFKDKIVPTRGQIIVTEPAEQFLQPSYCSHVLDYFRQLDDGRVLIGGFRNADVEKEVGYSDEINPLIHDKLKEFLDTHFPILRDKRIDYRWSGVMGFSKDGYPMVGALPEDPRIFYAGGFTGTGLGYTFATGELVSKMVLDGKDPGIFSGRRFK